MTHYRLTVVRVEDNPKYDAAEVERRARYHGMSYQEDRLPAATIDTRPLDVVLTDEEYEAVKQAIVRTWA